MPAWQLTHAGGLVAGFDAAAETCRPENRAHNSKPSAPAPVSARRILKLLSQAKANHALTVCVLSSASPRVEVRQTHMRFQVFRILLQHIVQHFVGAFYISCLSECASQRDLRHLDVGISGKSDFGFRLRFRVTSCDCEPERKDRVGENVARRMLNLGAELLNGQCGTVLVEQRSVEEMKIRRRGIAREELVELLSSLFVIAGKIRICGAAYGLQELPVLQGNILGQVLDPQPGESQIHQQVGIFDVMGGKEIVLRDGFFKSPCTDEQFRQMEANDLLVSRLFRCSLLDALLNIAERIIVGAGFEFRQSTQGESRTSVWLKLQKMIERINCGSEAVGTVLKQADVEPALGPVGLCRYGLAIEFNCEWDVLLITSFGRTRR